VQKPKQVNRNAIHHHVKSYYLFIETDQVAKSGDIANKLGIPSPMVKAYRILPDLTRKSGLKTWNWTRYKLQ
jgi:Mn-dependent DtxR family transcriptional regulator